MLVKISERRSRAVTLRGLLIHFILLLNPTTWLLDQNVETHTAYVHVCSIKHAPGRLNRKTPLQLLFIMGYELAVRWWPRIYPQVVTHPMNWDHEESTSSTTSLRSSFSSAPSWCLLFDFSTLFPLLLFLPLLYAAAHLGVKCHTLSLKDTGGESVTQPRRPPSSSRVQTPHMWSVCGPRSPEDAPSGCVE